MTRKDYIVIANAMALSRPSDAVGRHGWLSAVDELCRHFKADNSRFDANKFREACNR